VIHSSRQGMKISKSSVIALKKLTTFLYLQKIKRHDELFKNNSYFLVLICFSSRAEPGTENTTSDEAATAVEPEMDVVEE
jgi:hypothetical protein